MAGVALLQQPQSQAANDTTLETSGDSKVLKPTHTIHDRTRRALHVCAVVLALAVGGALIAAAIVWAPQRLVDDGGARADDRGGLSASEQIAAENSARTTLIQAFGGLFLLIGASFTLKQLRISRDQLQVASAQQALSADLGRATLEASRRAQTDEAWTRAVDQIGATSLTTRLGGIASMERLATTDDHLKSVVMEILSAYVRDATGRSASTTTLGPKSRGWWGEPAQRPSVDVQLALHVLGRLRQTKPGLEQLLEITDRRLLDFESANLRGANLTLGRYEGAQFHRADLDEANLSGGHFEGAVFYKASAARANFAGDFTAAFFAACDLAGADFSGSTLVGASFEHAKLPAARFDNADLRGADLSSAALDARTSFLGALCDTTTAWPEGFDITTEGIGIVVATDNSGDDDA